MNLATKIKWAVGIVLFLLAAVYADLRLKDVKKTAQQEIIQEFKDEALEQSIETQKADARMRDAVLQAERKKDEHYKAIIDKRDSVIDGLQKRPTRAEAADSQLSCPPGSGSGASLHREDATFLAREAARADGVMGERDFYYESYEKARLEIEKLKEKLE